VRLGLREGDLVRSINGIGLADGGALLQEIARSPAVELSVERSDGTQDRISVPREQLFESLSGLE
jgi:type II secretory pathway component PulC